MSVKVWDVRCTSCQYKKLNQTFADWDSPTGQCPSCHSPLEKFYSVKSRPHSWHPSSRVVLFRDPRNGDIKYPGRNDAPMPDRYRRQGFERVELGSLAEVTRHEKETGTMCEALHYDSNGTIDRLTDAEPKAPEVAFSNLLE